IERAGTLLPRERFGFCVHSGREPSESRGGTGTNDLTGLASHVAEPVRQLTGEIVSLTGAENARRTAHGQLNATADHDATFLAAVREHLLPGRRAGRVALVQQRQLPSRPLSGDQPQRDCLVAELRELGAAEEGLRRAAQVQREELRQGHGYPVEDLF